MSNILTFYDVSYISGMNPEEIKSLDRDELISKDLSNRVDIDLKDKVINIKGSNWYNHVHRENELIIQVYDRVNDTLEYYYHAINARFDEVED